MNHGIQADYISGSNFGWPDSVSVHRLANIVHAGVVVGENCRIDAFVTITGKVKIGARVHISTGASIFGTHGVVIGDGCSMSPGSKIFTGTSDVHSPSLSGACLENQNGIYGTVVIGSFTEIGSNSVILPGAVIGNEVQIGANATVRIGAKVPDNEVWAGVPAHYLFNRAPVDRALMMGTKVMERELG
jgi:acetyltransferase-like isoleucine patch superfamily enzyme